MKISKLFHWLYACVMLMPIFGIGVKCLYVAFNPNAKDSYSGNEEFTYYEKVETQLPSTFDNNYEPILNNVYLINGTYTTQYFDELSFVVTIKDGSFEIDEYDGEYLNEILPIEFSANNEIRYNFNDDYLYIYVYSTGDYFVSIYFENIISFTFYNCVVEVQEYTLYGENILSDDILSTTTYYETSYVEQTIEQTTLDNVFYVSVKEITQEPLFSWASNSFINEPIKYITNLFGMPSDSELITLLSYWLDISIIWLTFDLLMYVPLLAHRWLDKGSLE